jgi:hypothetical protein
MGHLDGIDLGGIERPGDRARMVEAILIPSPGLNFG